MRYCGGSLTLSTQPPFRSMINRESEGVVDSLMLLKLDTGARAAVEGLGLQGEREAGTRGRQGLIVVLQPCQVKRIAGSSLSLPVKQSTTGRGAFCWKHPIFED